MKSQRVSDETWMGFLGAVCFPDGTRPFCVGDQSQLRSWQTPTCSLETSTGTIATAKGRGRAQKSLDHVAG